MSKKSLFLILGICVLAVWWLIAARYQHIWPSNKTITNTDSSIKNIVSSDIKSEDLWQTRLIGSESIDIFNGYLNDNWTQQAYVASVSGDQELAGITKWFSTREINNDFPAIDVKVASIDAFSDRFKLINAAWLKDHIVTNNATIKEDGKDLLIEANPNEDSEWSPFLIIKKTNNKNYIINNSEDWFSEGVFMIPKDEYVVLTISWNNRINSTLSYENKQEKKVYRINIDSARSIQQARWDTSNRLGWLAKDQHTNLPVNTEFTLQIDYASRLENMTVYHVVFWKNTEQQAFLDDIKWKENVWMAGQVKKALSDLNKNVEKFTVIDQGDGNIKFKTSNDKLQAIIVTNKWFFNIYTIKTDVPFSAKMINEALSERMPYYKNIDATYPITSKSIVDSLNTILWSGNRTNESYYDRYFGFIYKVQPKKSYKGDITVTSIFWDTTKVPLDIYLENIDKKTIVEWILSNTTLNLLPDSGSFQDVLIQTKNTPKTTVEFQACTLNNKIDTTARQGGGLEDTLFSCNGTTYQKEFEIKDFVYWKGYRTPVALPDDFPKDAQAFKVTLPNAEFNYMEQNATTHYFYKSSIGIWTKTAWDKVFVRWFTFADNQPITQGTLTLKELNGKEIMRKNIAGEKTELSLLEKNGDRLVWPLLLEVGNWKDTSFVILGMGLSEHTITDNNSYTSLKINSFLDPTDLVNDSSNISFRSNDSAEKIYGYTDKALYKAGETIYYAWFTRDLSQFENLDYLKGKTVDVTIKNSRGESIHTSEKIALDEFGWFKWSATIPTTINLGDAIITYEVSNTDISFSQNIKIQEYQKPTFFADISHETKDGTVNLIVNPQYYFGETLKDYDITVDWSLAWTNACYYCWRENNEDFYYNVVFNDSISTWGKEVVYGNNGKQSIPLFNETTIEQKWYQYTLKATVIVRDKNSDEVQFFNKYIDFNPVVKLWLNGQAYDWLYKNDAKDPRDWYKIEWKVDGGRSNINSLKYDVYYYTYEPTTEQWVDGSVYYIYWTPFKQIASKSLWNGSNFKIDTDFIQQPWMYLIRVYATDKNGAVIGEVQKQIDYYDSTAGKDWMLGSLPNNYALNVNIPKKTYEEWEQIPINIEPYQKGARVVITVERGEDIIDSFEKTVDGSQLFIEAKKWYAPNVVINVMQIVGTDKATEQRKEPRFFAGFAEAEISTAMHELNIEIKSDKETYKPWETVKLDITTKDSKWNLVDSRISLGVVDKALLSLYDNIKEPLPYFFNKMWTSVKNYTNLKFLYQSLKAFANNGSKWWGGNGWKGMFSVIRDDLADVAFWRGGLILTGWKTTITFDLPANVTTWTIDAIWITKDTRVGTTRKDIVATKEFVMEANTPGFMTISDKIQVPVKLIGSPELAGKKVTGTAYIENEKWEKVDLGKFSSEVNSRILVPVSIPNEWINNRYIKLVISWEAGREKDGVSQIIPIRTDWLIAKDSMWFINQAWEHTFTIPEYHNGTVSLVMNTLPTNLIDPVLENIFFFPYANAGSEYIASQIASIYIANELADKWVFKTTLINWDNIITQDWEKNIEQLINDGITSLINNQNPNGSIRWRKWETYYDDSSVSSYALSSYVYGVLNRVGWAYNAPDQLNKTIQNLEKYLYDYRTLSDSSFLWYLTIKSEAGKKLSTQETAELNAMNPNKTPYGWLLRYAIAVYQWNNADMNTYRKTATVPTNADRTMESMFINQTTALLLKTDLLLKDPNATQQDRMEWLQNMIKLRNKNGNRWTTNTNTQALITLSHIDQKTRPTKDRISCEITVGDKKEHITVTASGTVFTQPIKNTTTQTKWACENPIVVDTMINYLPKDNNDLLGAKQHVTSMKYSIANPDAAIWETTKLIASFSTDLAWEQVGVNMYIPATFKLLDTIKPKSNIFSTSLSHLRDAYRDAQPFEVSDYQCTPDHWEVRFDRLFFYYDSLPPITCDISVKMIKSYDWDTTIMPMTISEIYKWTVNGRKVIIK